MPTTSQASLTPDSSNSLEVTAVACSRGERNLFDDLSFIAHQGQCTHIIGPNGSGKTTLLRVICGLNRSDKGTISWKQTPIQHSDVFLNESAYLGHKDGIKNELTAIENLRFQQQLEGLSDENALEDNLHSLQILNCADLPAQALSFGQRRRLAFAKLLLTHKPLWVLDEPFTGIDAAGRSLMESLCVDHLSKGGLIVMTHHRRLDDTALGDYRQEVFLNQHNATPDAPDRSKGAD